MRCLRRTTGAVPVQVGVNVVVTGLFTHVVGALSQPLFVNVHQQHIYLHLDSLQQIGGRSARGCYISLFEYLRHPSKARAGIAISELIKAFPLKCASSSNDCPKNTMVPVLISDCVTLRNA